MQLLNYCIYTNIDCYYNDAYFAMVYPFPTFKYHEYRCSLLHPAGQG